MVRWEPPKLPAGTGIQEVTTIVISSEGAARNRHAHLICLFLLLHWSRPFEVFFSSVFSLAMTGIFNLAFNGLVTAAQDSGSEPKLAPRAGPVVDAV